MNSHVIIPSTTFEQLGKLANLLEQATQVVRSVLQTHTKTLTPVIPKLKRPKHVPKDQEWFWTKEWQRGEREANADLAAGRYKTFDSVEDLIADLHSSA